MGGWHRPEVPGPGGTGLGSRSQQSQEGERGPAGATKERQSRPSVPPPVLGSRRRGYSAGLASAPSALPSTSSSEQSPVPFRAIRRGTTNGRSPRLGAEAEVSSAGQDGHRRAHMIERDLQWETRHLASLWRSEGHAACGARPPGRAGGL